MLRLYPHYPSKPLMLLSLSPREQACDWAMPPVLDVLHGSGASGQAHWLKDLSRSGLTSLTWCTPEHTVQLGARKKNQNGETQVKHQRKL